MNKLFEALVKAQSEMPIVGKNCENAHFKYRYADIADIIKACGPVLHANGLAIVHSMGFEGETNYLETILIHTSGESLRSKVKITPAKNDLQSFGGAITYLRRYSYAAIIGLAISDDDDDGQSAMPAPAKPISVDYISDDQIDQLEDELKGHADIRATLLSGMGIKSFAQIPRDKFIGVFKRVQQIKATKAGH